MLIRFNVKNFLSFSSRANGSSEEFSMIAGKVRSKKEHITDDGHIKLLKFASVYGANASGKSNLVKAINFMRHAVLVGLPNGHTEYYCKSNPANKNKESYFEIEIKIDEQYYSYGFEVLLSKGEFVSEWLVELLPNGDDKEIFYRNIISKEINFGSKIKNVELLNRLNVYAEDIKDDSSVLFLYMMNQNKRNLYSQYPEVIPMNKVYTWMKECLNINYPDRPISDYSYLTKTDSVDEVCRIISAFGTGITDYKLVDIPVERAFENMPKALRAELTADLESRAKEIEESVKLSSPQKQIESIGIVIRNNKDYYMLKVDASQKNTENFITCKTLRFYHGTSDILFRLREESDGTIRLLDLLDILITGAGKTYIVDELDRCLHPSMTYKFVETFLQVAEKLDIQLIVTTHESRLLDFDLLRRDEIWFINKNSAGSSSIYSLEEYNARFDQKIDKAYLEGRYGGVPIFNTIFPIGES